MTTLNYQHFFETATAEDAASEDIATKKSRGPSPYAYQIRLACGERGAESVADAEWLVRGASCESRLISVPTGLGKTAAVVLAWLWNRVAHPDSGHRETWPRRLIYCLPMRTLVEQTRDEVSRWVNNLLASADLGLDAAAREQLEWLTKHSPIILMGGEENDPVRRDWDLHPERPAILIGTQDMLLSRALNRGYGMARARWPMHFGLLNNDALWVLDETQLMGVGLATSAQLQAFRNPETKTHTWWMSATLQSSWLETPDTRELVTGFPPPVTTALPPEIAEIQKPLALSPAVDDKSVAAFVESLPLIGVMLVILNTVRRARAVYDALIKKKSFGDADIHLVHSRFRPHERAAWLTQFLSRDAKTEKPRVIIATQVVEAGVDISADTLVTELAPWTSLVQRFGRAARYGGTARITVLDIADEKTAAPYEFAELEAARAELKQLADVSIKSLVAHEKSLTPERRAALYPYSPDFLLLRHEVDELFDTTPDLSGSDLDISRYIRSGADTDCQIAWVAEKPASNYAPSASELCSAPIGETRKFAETRKGFVWRWDYLDGEWKSVGKNDIYPGVTLVALASKGGYSEKTGFDPASKKPVPLLPSKPPLFESPDSLQNSDALSVGDTFQTIREHTEKVCGELKKIGLELSPILEHAALWHDLGKAHPAFQSLIKENPGADTAKAPDGRWLKEAKVSETDSRPGFRHELASALALLALREQLPVQFSDEDFDLLLYLVAAHHGKVRARLAASPSDQKHPVAETGAGMPVRGVMDGDVVPGAALGLPAATLSLDPAAIGFSPKTGASWTERVLGLLEKFGPFRLAFLETLLRAADCRASRSK
jgi:CRISPR-associated endonuclease/helicase Cas3